VAARIATLEELVALAPDLASVDPCILEAWLEIAGTMISISVWGSKASHGHRLLAAHLYQVSQPGGETGPLASVTVGPVAKSFAVTASADAELGSTQWGRMYLTLRRTLCRTPVAINTRLSPRQFRG